jgi:hypothetical protein
MKAVATDPNKPSPEITANAADSKDFPVWAPVEIEIRKAEFDKEFTRILPGPPSAPPLDLSPGDRVCHMAHAWSVVELEARSTLARVALGHLKPEDAPGVQNMAGYSDLERSCNEYAEMVNALIEGKRRQRNPGDLKP